MYWLYCTGIRAITGLPHQGLALLCINVAALAFMASKAKPAAAPLLHCIAHTTCQAAETPKLQM
jgi:hypothetical protein